MEKPICSIRILRDDENQQNVFIEYSFNAIKSHKRFWLSTEREIRPFNKEIITNILRETVLKIISHKRFWDLFSDIVSTGRSNAPQKRRIRRRVKPHKTSTNLDV
ncbi:hypothetical protein J7L67_03005 [bacterium]|nr:hypothetical protein [bacterium]